MIFPNEVDNQLGKKTALFSNILKDGLNTEIMYNF